jgi:hypothetical protein
VKRAVIAVERQAHEINGIPKTQGTTNVRHISQGRGKGGDGKLITHSSAYSAYPDAQPTKQTKNTHPPFFD